MSKKSLVLAAAGIGFAGLQLVRPTLTNPPVKADLAVPAAVKQILRRSCYDCHSNETHLPWFDRIVPAYWLVARDVNAGRKHLNFSEAGEWPAPKQKAALWESVNHVILGAMPPKSYLAIHPGARVTAEELETLKAYLSALVPKPAPAVAQASVSPSPGVVVKPTLNGIEFPAGYRAWKPISGTERFDNGTVRAILGNDRAVRAIDENTIAPWPDGAAFAKLAWTAALNPDQTASAGAFYQVEFMFKDRERYAKTGGWGWARWRGPELTPYGKSADFAEECVGCHAPLKDSDLVFTFPIRRSAKGSPSMNEVAALPQMGPFHPLDGQVLSVFVDPKLSTYALLQANDVAARHARTDGSAAYPAGSILALVTWTEVDDSRWFGARVPGPVASVEILRRDGTGAEWTHESYERVAVSGNLERVALNGTPGSRGRTARMLESRAASMPSP